MTKVNFFSFIALVIAFVITTSATNAAVYKWTDENGKVHFTDKPPKHLKKKSSIVNIKSKTTTSTARFPVVANLKPIKKHDLS